VIGVEADQRVNRASAANCQDRGRFDVSKHFGEQTSIFFLFFIPEWQIESATEYKSVPLVVY